KIRTGSAAGLGQAESAERRVSPPACLSLPISIDHSGNAELVFVFVPTKRHFHIGRMFVVDPGGFETKRSRQLLARKNDAGKIGLLQKFNQALNHGCVVSDNVKQNSA